MKKKTACIIIPHIDDDIYSCWSILCDKSYDEIIVVKCTTGEHQRNRVIIHDRLQEEPEMYNLNPHIKIKWLFGSEDDTPQDGLLNKVHDVKLVSELDKYVQSGIEEFYYPSDSHHQDHHKINKACKAALRPRESFKIKKAYEYTYMYNHSREDAVSYKAMTYQDLANKIKFLEDLDSYDGILSKSSVNSSRYVENSNMNFGWECGAEAAEKFIPFFELI